VRQQGRHPAELPIAIRARKMWAQMAALIGTDAEFEATGHLKLARNEAEEAELLRWNAMAAEYGLHPRMIGRNAIRADHPYFSDKVVAGSLLEEDGSANPRLLTPAIAAAAWAAGAILLEGHAVTGIAPGFVVEAKGQTFTAPVLLNTGGFWGGQVAAQFGEPVPISALNPNMMVTEPLPVFCTHNLGVVGGDIYLRQISRGNIIFGGGRAESDPAVPVSRPLPAPSFNAMDRAIEILPQLAGAMVIRSWTGIDGGMPDALPVMGPSRTTPGLFHAFGFSGHGFMLGPAVGAVLSELVLDGRSETPLEGFDIGRFARQDAPTDDTWKTRLE
jgi:sarcosine oxidase subunit beta